MTTIDKDEPEELPKGYESRNEPTLKEIRKHRERQKEIERMQREIQLDEFENRVMRRGQ